MIKFWEFSGLICFLFFFPFFGTSQTLIEIVRNQDQDKEFFTKEIFNNYKFFLLVDELVLPVERISDSLLLGPILDSITLEKIKNDDYVVVQFQSEKHCFITQFPNVFIESDQIIYHGAEHLGIAVDTERGLLVPVIHNAGDLNMGGVARKIADLAARTRDNKVTPDELGGGTFTLTNTGSRGALFDTPIINQPQVAILGLGAVVKRPMVVKGEDGGETIAIRSMVYLGLSYDHRVVDGADAARFLVTLKERLEGGAFEADLGL